jgi:hypothetical protein
MFADTIAEYYVEQNHVRIELEIGQADIASFRNLLPDSIHQELGFGDEPFKDRLKRFYIQRPGDSLQRRAFTRFRPGHGPGNAAAA